MRKQAGRYSKLIRPSIMVIDCLILILCTYYSFSNHTNLVLNCFLIVFSWHITAYFTKFYEVYRFTKLLSILSKVIKQKVFFALLIYAYIGIYAISIPTKEPIIFLIGSFVSISIFKFSFFLLLKYFRKHYRGNHRKVLIISTNFYAKELERFFVHGKEYGYILIDKFNKFDEKNLCILHKEHHIDEIYLALNSDTELQVKEFISFCDKHFITLKYIPSKNSLLTHQKNIQYYGYIPIIPEHQTPLEQPMNYFIKRLFDIFFSIFIILGILSWLYPLLAILIKMESKGPVIFKQKRSGRHYKEFYCYKFRSMKINEEADQKQATANDMRITKIGKFIRKTSIDELPQFFNVLKGDMSVCGPRPHMLKHTQQFEMKISRYKLRHYIKPGITGMAQTHGCRGEIITHNDLKNRVKYDIFYIENWNLLLDIKIIYLTIKNALKGEEKAL